MINFSEIIVITLNFISVLIFLDYSIYELLSKYIVFIETFLMILIFFKKIKKINKYFIFFIFFVLIITFVCININNGGIGSIVVLFNFIVLVYISGLIKVRKKIIKNISLMYILLFFYWCFLGKVSNYNTNTIGLINMFGIIYGIIYIKIKNSKITSLFLISILSFASYFIQNNIAHSRTSSICSIAFLILIYLVPQKLIYNKIIYWFIVIALTLGSLIWTKFYVMLYNFNPDLYINFYVTKKRFFSGRELIWKDLWEKLNNNFFIGLGSSYKMPNFDNSFNVHNSIFNFLVVYGIVVFILIFILILYKYKKIRGTKESNEKVKFIAICGTFIILLYGFSEVILISSAFYGTIFTLFVLASSNNITDFNKIKKNTNINKNIT